MCEIMSLFDKREYDWKRRIQGIHDTEIVVYKSQFSAQIKKCRIHGNNVRELANQVNMNFYVWHNQLNIFIASSLNVKRS